MPTRARLRTRGPTPKGGVVGATLSPPYHPFAAHYLVRRIDLGPVSITKAAIHHVTYSARGVDAVVALAAIEPILTVVPVYNVVALATVEPIPTVLPVYHVGASRDKHHVVAIPGPDVVGVDGA